MKPAKALLLTLLILVVYFVHQDFWNWKKAEPLVFGFLPIGLAYHAGYSVLAAVLMALLVKFAWPKHLEHIDTKPSDSSTAKPSKTDLEN
jgi:hypothetical protein